MHPNERIQRSHRTQIAAALRGGVGARLHAAQQNKTEHAFSPISRGGKKKKKRNHTGCAPKQRGTLYPCPYLPFASDVPSDRCARATTLLPAVARRAYSASYHVGRLLLSRRGSRASGLPLHNTHACAAPWFTQASALADKGQRKVVNFTLKSGQS